MRSSVYAAVRPSVRRCNNNRFLVGLWTTVFWLSYPPLRPYGISPFRSGRWTDPPLPLHHRFLLHHALSLSLFLFLFLSGLRLAANWCPSPSHSEAWGPNEDVSSRPGPRAQSCLRPHSVLVALMPRPHCAVWPLGTGRSRKTLA